jgi:hypothetical protein
MIITAVAAARNNVKVLATMATLMVRFHSRTDFLYAGILKKNTGKKLFVLFFCSCFNVLRF